LTAVNDFTGMPGYIFIEIAARCVMDGGEQWKENS